MKKMYFGIIAFVVISAFTFTQCGNGCKGPKPTSEWKELYDVFSSIPTNKVFSQIEECKNPDLEVKYILSTKSELDTALVTLRRLADKSHKVKDLSDKTAFTKQIVQLQGMSTSIQEVTNEFKTHLVFAVSFLGTEPTNNYDRAKKALMSVDNSIMETGQTVLNELTNYDAVQTSFGGVLAKILAFVSNGDLKSAANELGGEEVYNYYLSTAKMLKSIYDFEVARALSVKEAYDAYNVK